jgi:GNAT superfamily N-acetyltransferase
VASPEPVLRTVAVVGPSQVSLHEATARDVEALIDALYAAANWHGRAPFGRDEVMRRSDLAHYVMGWPRAGDFGTVATLDDRPVGAAWCRAFSADDPGYGFLAPDVPEISMGVEALHRGRGIGSSLLAALIAQARTYGCTALSLSVEDENPARAMYRRQGFVVVGRDGNSDTMRLDLATA